MRGWDISDGVGFSIITRTIHRGVLQLLYHYGNFVGINQEIFCKCLILCFSVNENIFKVLALQVSQGLHRP